MIGWYADIGWIDNPNNIKTLSSIQFLDYNKRVIIPVLKSGVEIGEKGERLQQDDINTARDFLNEYLGNDSDSLYSLPAYLIGEVQNELLLQRLTSVVPSSVSEYPKMYELINTAKTERFSVCPCVHIKSLNRLYVGSNAPTSTSGSRYVVYSVDGDNLTLLFNGSINIGTYNIFPIRRNNYIYFNILKEYSADTILSDVRSYAVNYTYNASTGRYGIRYSEVISNIRSSVTPIEYPITVGIMGSTNIESPDPKFFEALFPTGSKPDFIQDGPGNPYEPGGESGEGTLPPGTFDESSDPIPDSTIPTLSSANTGFTRIYNPTLSQVQELAKYLWTDESVIQTIWNHIKQFFENPMEAIIGFNLVPVQVPDGGNQNFALMYIDTGVQMNVAASQFVDVDCGTLKVERYYGSALDQSPYTKVSCFLPYVGLVQLNTDEVMGTTLQVKYRVDIASGSCVAKIFIDGNCLYQYGGHCAIPIPFSAADFSSYVNSAISVAKLGIGIAAAGALGAAAAAAGDPVQQTNRTVTTSSKSVETERNPATGRQITSGTKQSTVTKEVREDKTNTQASFEGITALNISNTVGQVMTTKPHVEHSGSFSGNTGYLGIRRPYLIIERPNMCLPASYQTMNGYPSMITMELSTCSGYTRVQQVQLTGMTATNPEQAEILQFLKSGVIF